jgi:hypothetical protein
MRTHTPPCVYAPSGTATHGTATARLTGRGASCLSAGALPVSTHTVTYGGSHREGCILSVCQRAAPESPAPLQGQLAALAARYGHFVTRNGSVHCEPAGVLPAARCCCVYGVSESLRVVCSPRRSVLSR